MLAELFEVWTWDRKSNTIFTEFIRTFYGIGCSFVGRSPQLSYPGIFRAQIEEFGFSKTSRHRRTEDGVRAADQWPHGIETSTGGLLAERMPEISFENYDS